MKARNLLIGLSLFTLLITSAFSAEDSCPTGMRKMYVDDTNMNSYGSARKWLGAVCFFNFPGSLFFQRKVLIEPRFEVHLKAAVDAIEEVDYPQEQNIYGFTIIITGAKSTISGMNTRTVTGGASTSRSFSDIGYGNFVNAFNQNSSIANGTFYMFRCSINYFSFPILFTYWASPPNF